MISSEEREVIFEKFFSSLANANANWGASIRHYIVIEAKVKKDFVKKESCNAFCSNGFHHGTKNHLLSKPMVNHDQKRIEAI